MLIHIVEVKKWVLHGVFVFAGKKFGTSNTGIIVPPSGPKKY